MGVNTLRRGLNRETRALLQHIRRVWPLNRLYEGLGPRPKPALLPTIGGSIRG
jgi:hypothetical protein